MTPMHYLEHMQKPYNIHKLGKKSHPQNIIIIKLVKKTVEKLD
jgi:hypothetical protein